MGIIIYLAGLLTLPVLYAVYCVVSWCFSNTMARYCEVCDRMPRRDIDAHFNISELTRYWWHRLFWATRKEHKQAHQAHREKWGY